VPPFAPNRLRHTTATKLRQTFGIEGARSVLGHRAASVTEIYAERDMNRITQIMAEVG
jgi:site-specific recombinase XerC